MTREEVIRILEEIKAEIKKEEDETSEEIRYGSTNKEYYNGKVMGLASAIGTINKHIDKFMKLGKSEV